VSEQVFSIRRATVGDAPIISAHRRGMMEDIGRGTPETLEAMQTRFTSWVANKLACGEYLGWLVETEETRIVAGAGVLLSDQIPSPGNLAMRSAYVLNVFVERDYRQRGLARCLMEAIMDFCRAQHIRTVSLHASPAGRHLYETMGFQPTNEMRLSLKEK
jgi:GNAT superfamily N-acetyltransferase